MTQEFQDLLDSTDELIKAANEHLKSQGKKPVNRIPKTYECSTGRLFQIYKLGFKHSKDKENIEIEDFINMIESLFSVKDGENAIYH
jgi:UDP-glucose 6-dehydrogenase